MFKKLLRIIRAVYKTFINRAMIGAIMPALDRLNDDESYEAFKQGVDGIVDAMDDPERVRELIQEGEYERAREHIHMQSDDMETQLQILHGLANKIVDSDPELKGELEDELPNKDELPRDE